MVPTDADPQSRCMNNDLMRYGDGDRPPPRDRKLARSAKEAVDEVRLAALRADGAMALAAHIMEGFVGLDDFRKSLSGGDPLKDTMLMDIEAAALRQVRGIQTGLYNRWDV